MLTKATKLDQGLILDYCMAEPNINIFIIGDIETHGFESDFQDVWIQTNQNILLKNGDETAPNHLTGIVLRYHDNFIVYSEKNDMDFSEVLDFLKTQSKTHQVNIISGKKSVVEPLYLALGEDYRKREMSFCALKDASKLLSDTSKTQVATMSDAREIAETYGQIAEFAGLYSADPEQRYQQIAKRIESGEGVHVVVKADGSIISHGNTTAETSVSAMIGGVFTLPEYRRKGYASTIVSALCHVLIKKGKSACLFYDNPESERLFQKLGFETIENWTILGRQ
jgi:predicted GNAT family acetyltransferase